MVTALELQVLPPLSGLVSNGFQIVDPAIFSYDKNPDEVVSMEEVILRVIQGNSGVLAVPLESGRFIDCGTPESLIFAKESWYS
jgi:NDP-sugar pyrophosphorylase family protein